MKILLNQLKALQISLVANRGENHQQIKKSYCWCSNMKLTPQYKENLSLMVFFQQSFSLIDVKLDSNNFEKVKNMPGIESLRMIEQQLFVLRISIWQFSWLIR